MWLTLLLLVFSDAAFTPNQVFSAVNTLRAKAGRAAVCRNQQIDIIAQTQAQDSSRCGGSFCCLTPPCSDAEKFASINYAFRKHNKLLAYGNTPLDQLIGSWDQATLLDPELTNLGVGVAYAGNVAYLVAWFAQPAVTMDSGCGPRVTPIQERQILDQLAAQVHVLINQERASQGRGPLCLNTKLQSAAYQHSVDQASCGIMSHECCSKAPGCNDVAVRVQAVGYDFLLVGENVADANFDAATVVRAWMNSPKHRENILNGAFKNTGIGLAEQRGRLFWTQVFGNPRGSGGCDSAPSAASVPLATPPVAAIPPFKPPSAAPIPLAIPLAKPPSAAPIPLPKTPSVAPGATAAASACSEATPLCQCTLARCGTAFGWSTGAGRCAAGHTTDDEEFKPCLPASTSAQAGATANGQEPACSEATPLCQCTLARCGTSFGWSTGAGRCAAGHTTDDLEFKPCLPAPAPAPLAVATTAHPTAACSAATPLCECVPSNCGPDWGWSRTSGACTLGATTEVEELLPCENTLFPVANAPVPKPLATKPPTAPSHQKVCNAATPLCKCTRANCGPGWGWSRTSGSCTKGATTVPEDLAPCKKGKGKGP